AVAVAHRGLPDGAALRPRRLVGPQQQLDLARLGHVLGQDLDVVWPRHLPAGERRHLDTPGRAPRRRRRRLRRLAQPVLGEVGGVGETGGLAPDDPDPGTAVAARRELFDLALLERRRGRAPVLGEHLGEIAPRAEGGAEHALEDGFVDHRNPAYRTQLAIGPGLARSAYPAVEDGDTAI